MFSTAIDHWLRWSGARFVSALSLSPLGLFAMSFSVLGAGCATDGDTLPWGEKSPGVGRSGWAEAVLEPGRVPGDAPVEPLQRDAQPVTPICDFGLSSPLGDSTTPLRSVAPREASVNGAKLSSLSDLRLRQLETATRLVRTIEPGEAFDVALTRIDDRTVYLRRGRFKDIPFDWLEYYAGDTEVGAFFWAETTEVLGEVSDGQILGCRSQAEP